MRPVIILALALSMALGCAHPSKLIGTWTSTVPGRGAATFTFNSDGTMVMSTQFNPKYPSAKMDILGKWEEQGDKLVISRTDVQFENLPEALKADANQFRRMALASPQATAQQQMKIQFEGDNAFTTTDNMSMQTKFSRVLTK